MVIAERKLKLLLAQKLDDLRFPSEMKSFCRDCKNSLIDVLQKYRALETEHSNLVVLLDESKQAAKSWEQTFDDLNLVVKETKEVLETLRRENEWNAEIISEWEQRKLEEAIQT